MRKYPGKRVIGQGEVFCLAHGDAWRTITLRTILSAWRCVMQVIKVSPEAISDATGCESEAASIAAKQVMRQGYAFLPVNDIYLRPDGLINVYRRFRPIR